MADRIKRGLKNFIKIITKPEMGILPGHLAFSIVLSIVPTITIISYIASSLNISMDFLSTTLTKTFNADVVNILFSTNNVTHLDYRFILTLIAAYIFASNGAAAVIISSNTIYGIKNDSFLKRRIKAFFMILIIILLFIFLIIFNVFGNRIVEMLEFADISKHVLTNIILIINVLRGPVSWFIIFVFIKILFTMAPDKKIPSRDVNKGAIFTTIGFIIVTFIYSSYVTNFARYDVFYGNLANIVVLMIWLYLLSYIITIGLALNYREEVINFEKTLQIEKEKVEN